MPNAVQADPQKKEEKRAMFVAAEKGDATATASLLASGARADARLSKGGETPLMRAAARGHLEVARLLLDAGADASARRADGFTPLILAVFFGHEQIVSLLLERGADAFARTTLGTTAARWAAARGFEAMASMLRKAEAARATEAATLERESVAASLVKTTISRSDEVSIFSTLYAANASVRSDSRLPAHPSASTFRLGHFLRSWQGSVGAALLLLAFAVSVFAFLRGGGTTAREASRTAPLPSPSAPEVVAQQPALQSSSTPQPSPAFPTPDAQAVMPVTDPAYALPNTVGQPFYVAPGAAVPGQPSTTRDLAVVSESGTPSTEEAGRSKRKTDANTNESAPAATRIEGRDDAASASDSRAARNTRPSEAEQQRPAQPSTTPAPAPPPQPTPARAKVIQWPPQ
jgi:hypothetical protein